MIGPITKAPPTYAPIPIKVAIVNIESIIIIIITFMICVTYTSM